jgi:hypothetical protein
MSITRISRPVRRWIGEYLENYASDIDAVFKRVTADEVYTDAFVEKAELDENVSGDVTLDVAAVNTYAHKITGDTTYSVFYPPEIEGYRGLSLTILVEQDSNGGHSITFPTNVAWNGGTTPSLSTNPGDAYAVSFTSFNDGADWVAAVSPLYEGGGLVTGGVADA